MMLRLSFVLTFLVTSLIAGAQDVIAGMSLERLQRYEDFVQKEIDDRKISGAVSLISRKGEVVYSKALGTSNVSTNTAMSEDHLFYIQSMTKPIITVAFMTLYEEGHFLLADPVSRYIPEFKELVVIKDPEEGKTGQTVPLKREITIKDLLSHTSGLSHGLGGNKLEQEIFEDQYGQEHQSVQTRLQSLLAFPLIGQPGEQWHYSCAPDVLSVLIEQFSGMPTNEFLIERIFNPLGMQDTRYNLDKDQRKRVASLHFYDEDGNLAVGNDDLGGKTHGNTIWSGVNGLWSTAADYMTFCRMMMNNGELDDVRILSRKTVELMTANHVGDLFGSGVGFGLGYGVVTSIADNGFIGSEGTFWWGGAFNTHFFIDPKEELVSIFMTQLAPYTNYYHEKLRVLTSQAIVD